MDKIFGQNIIEQDNILCKFHPEILKIISEFLPPKDVVHLSQTCKELHQKLPFYLLKCGTFTLAGSLKGYLLFEGPASNFSIREINISFTAPTSSRLSLFMCSSISVWIQIIRRGIVVLETQKYLTERTGDRSFGIKIKNATLKECKCGDRLRFMGQDTEKYAVSSGSMQYVFEVSLQLENYKYGNKPVDITERVKGYAGFKYPSVFIDIEDAFKSYYHSREGLQHLDLLDVLTGNTNFYIIKLLDFIFDIATIIFMTSKYSMT